MIFDAKTGLIAKFGRKFFLAMYAMTLGALVAFIGFYVMAKVPTVAGHIAEVMGQFAIVLSVAMGAFAGSSAAIEWKHGGAPGAPDPTLTTGAIVPAPASAPPRPSGMVADIPPET